MIHQRTICFVWISCDQCFQFTPALDGEDTEASIRLAAAAGYSRHRQADGTIRDLCSTCYPPIPGPAEPAAETTAEPQPTSSSSEAEP